MNCFYIGVFDHHFNETVTVDFNTNKGVVTFKLSNVNYDNIYDCNGFILMTNDTCLINYKLIKHLTNKIVLYNFNNKPIKHKHLFCSDNYQVMFLELLAYFVGEDVQYV